MDRCGVINPEPLILGAYLGERDPLGLLRICVNSWKNITRVGF